jgi:PhnB protein
MSVYAYINFDGNCSEAVEFYRQVFCTEAPEIMTYGDAPPDLESPVQDEHKHLVMHTALDIFGTTVMFSDLLPGEPLVKGSNISLAIMMQDIEAIKPLFDKLKERGSVEMELQETFFSKLYGSLKDKFGIIWQVMHDDGEM